ncbi:hypothetical protein CR513_09456, partial [Mucuna pruriens]
MLIKLALLPWTQVLLCLCVPNLSEAEFRVYRLRSSTNPLYDLYPKIKLTLRRIRKARNIVVSNSSNSDSVSSSNNNNSATNDSYFVEYSSTNFLAKSR